MAHEHTEFNLLIEDCNRKQCRQLEYTCICTQTDNGLKILVNGVRNINTNEVIKDPNKLPPIKRVMEAAALYNWHFANQAVFTETQVSYTGVTREDGREDGREEDWELGE